VVVIESFDAAFAAIEADPFVEEVLGRDLHARHVVVGYDFTFGHGRHGTPSVLTALGPAVGIAVTVVPGGDGRGPGLLVDQDPRVRARGAGRRRPACSWGAPSS
jgi:riboflavin kinase/FMN adenylyltransferase